MEFCVVQAEMSIRTELVLRKLKDLSCSLKCDGKFSIRCYIQNPFPECIFISYSKKSHL